MPDPGTRISSGDANRGVHGGGWWRLPAPFGVDTGGAQVRDALLIAFHYPPVTGSSGLLRTLSFSRDLPLHGWRTRVLSACPRAYERTSDDLLAMIPAGTGVVRAWALDTARHLAIGGRYADVLALPDRWVTWLLGAVPAGLRMILARRPGVVWSTYPIATAHLAGWLLHRLTGVPWVADFRDPMVEQDPRTGDWTPADARLRSVRLRIERLCAARAARLVFCTEPARRIFIERHGPHMESRSVVIPNGYDEEAFAGAEADHPRRAKRQGEPLVLLHSGIIYPTPDRDPGAFLDALQSLRRQGEVDPARLRVVFRASGHDDWLRARIRERECEDLVTLAPPLPYRQALREMLDADGLLVFQGYTSNPAIPAKIYEYIRAGRPILALADPEGATAGLMRSDRLGVLADIASTPAIEAALRKFLVDTRSGALQGLPPEARTRHSRSHGARLLAAEFAAVGAPA